MPRTCCAFLPLLLLPPLRGRGTAAAAPPPPACDDIPPGSQGTCAQQKGWGKCGATWMVGHCCRTCFNCSAGCGAPPPPPPPPLPPPPAGYAPSDPRATAGAAALLSFLGDVSASPSFLFGHHNTNYEGQAWKDKSATENRSDVLTAVGQFPGLFGYNFDWVARGTTDIMPHVRHAAAQGAVVQIYWEASNPATNGSAKDLSGSPATALLPGGTANGVWRLWMDRVADFALAAGVPLVFRPFHENTGNWFWWGASSTTPAQYRAVWNYTAHYLRDTRGVHNMLYAYSPSKPASTEFDGGRYPGDALVDVACFDHYDAGDFHAALLDDCRVTVDFASRHGKVPAICEVGVRQGVQNLAAADAAAWYDADFLAPVAGDAACRRAAWALTWRNSAPDSYWVPLPEQPAYPGFAALHRSNATLFAGDFALPPAAAAA